MVSVTCSGINEEQSTIVQEFADANGFTFVDNYDDSVTHVIVQDDFSTYQSCYEDSKYILAISNKKWVLRYQWIIESLEANEVLNEENFEPSDPCSNTLVSRTARQSPKNLFTGFNFYINVRPDVLFEDRALESSIDDIKSIITRNGGTVVPRKLDLNGQQRGIVLLSNSDDFEDGDHLSVNWQWIVKSIKYYELQPLYIYIIPLELYENNNVPFPEEFVNYIAERQNFNRIRYKLQAMFNDVNPQYIFTITSRFLRKYCSRHEEIAVEQLIDHLLQEGQFHQRENIHFEIDVPVNLEVKTNHLRGIFPQADPEYLREFVEKCENDDEYSRFVEEKLSNPDFPTMEDYLSRKKVAELKENYIDNFNIEEFLQIFPKPMEHFENKSRMCSYDDKTLKYLKAYFCDLDGTLIEDEYKKNSYNLSMTAKVLIKENPDIICNLNFINVIEVFDNLLLLQELAYIHNFKNIEKYFDERKIERQNIIDELKKSNALLKCENCFDDECIPEECERCNNDKHIVCYDCLKTAVDVVISEGKCHIKCPARECDGEISLQTLKKIITPFKFDILEKTHRCEELLAANIEGVEYCPVCSYPAILESGCRVLSCEHCEKDTCILCKKPNHIPRQCDELEKKEKARHLLEEKMSQALIRKCYSCGKAYLKDGIACNLISCDCGAKMCYLCDKEEVGYSHFNAQGDDKSHLCPLWSDDNHLDVKSVHTIAQAFLLKLSQENPQLALNDTEKLMPVLPPKVSGSHDSVCNAYMTPVRVQQIEEAIKNDSIA